MDFLIKGLIKNSADLRVFFTQLQVHLPAARPWPQFKSVALPGGRCGSIVGGCGVVVFFLG